MRAASRVIDQRAIVAEKAPAPIGGRHGRAREELDIQIYMTNNVIMKSSRERKLPKAWMKVSRVCVALGDAHRQRILLLFEPSEKLAIRQILQTSALSRTAVSHHLRVMREAGVLVPEKVGKEVFYRIDKEYVRTQLAAIIDYIDAEL